MKKLILSIFAVVLFAVSLSAQERGTSRDFWRRPVQVQTNNIRPIPTAANQIIISDTTTNGSIRYVGKDFATAAAEAGVGAVPTFFTSTDTTYMVYAGDTSVVTTKGYREYVALLTQTGTNAPVATVLSNTLGGTPVWGYDGVGSYTLSLSNAFPLDKTTVETSVSYNAGSFAYAFFISEGAELRDASTLHVVSLGDSGTISAANGVLVNAVIKIKVYD